MSKAAMFATGKHRATHDAATRQDIEAGGSNGCVGTTLVSETDEVRVWHLLLPAGQRCAFHTHVLDYFWTCHSNGRARNLFADGTYNEDDYRVGDTRHMKFRSGEHMTHALDNIGDTDLLFTTVEYIKGSANAPLPVPDSVRRKVAA